MYIFEARYFDVDSCKTVTRPIELQEVGSDRVTFVQAMMIAYDRASESEQLVSLEYIAS